MGEIDAANAEACDHRAGAAARPTSVLLGLRDCRRTRSSAGRATRRSPACRWPSGCAALREPDVARAHPGGGAFDGSTCPLFQRVDRWDAHVSASAIRRTTSRSAEDSIARVRRARGPRAGGGRLRPPDRGRRPGCCTCRSPTTPHGNLDVVREMLAAPNTLIGLGDGGAHVGIICDASYQTYALTHWTRDRGAARCSRSRGRSSG